MSKKEILKVAKRIKEISSIKKSRDYIRNAQVTKTNVILIVISSKRLIIFLILFFFLKSFRNLFLNDLTSLFFASVYSKSIDYVIESDGAKTPTDFFCLFTTLPNIDLSLLYCYTD